MDDKTLKVLEIAEISKVLGEELMLAVGKFLHNSEERNSLVFMCIIGTAFINSLGCCLESIADATSNEEGRRILQDKCKKFTCVVKESLIETFNLASTNEEKLYSKMSNGYRKVKEPH
jgi:hypothetical protein